DEAGSKVLERIDRLQPLDRIGRHGDPRRRHQVGIGAMMRTTDPAAQLVQLRQPEAVGAIDDDGICCRHIDAAFDDRRAQQDVEAAVVEIEHDLLELTLGHLAVPDTYGRFRNQRANTFGDAFDVLHPVVDEVDLSSALDLAKYRLAYYCVVPLGDKRLDRQAVSRRRGDERHLPQSAERHVQGSRNRRGRQRQDVYFGTQRLDGFLVAHAETMLFVNDDEADVTKILSVLQQAMRAYDHIHVARPKSLDDTLRILSGAEPGQDFHAYGPVGETVLERLAVLLREQGRRHEYCDLLAAMHCRERGAQLDFRFADANFAANHAGL